jgi:hypothetical protein
VTDEEKLAWKPTERELEERLDEIVEEIKLVMGRDFWSANVAHVSFQTGYSPQVVARVRLLARSR